MPIYIVMRLEPWWNMALWTFEQNVGVGDWTGYPLDCYDYLSTCGAKNLTSHHILILLRGGRDR